MLLEKTIFQLDLGPLPPELALTLGRLGYMQWLGALPGDADYRRSALEAYGRAQPFASHSSAVAVFCDLLVASTGTPLRPLSLVSATRDRQGGPLVRRNVGSARAVR